MYFFVIFLTYSQSRIHIPYIKNKGSSIYLIIIN